MKQRICAVISNRELYPGVFLMWLDAGALARQVKPGQFLMVKCGGETILRRPVSLHNADDNTIALLYAVVGKGTVWLAEQKPGEKIDLLGPLGHGFQTPSDIKNLLLVAGGIGIAPLVYAAAGAVRAGKKVTLLLGAATAKKLYPRRLLPKGVKVIVATDDGSRGHRGPVTDLIPGFAGAAEQILVCGPMPMLRHVAGHRQELGMAGKNVQISMEMRMACGFGVCLGCTIRTQDGPKEVCKDGPVFRLEDIIWDEMTRI